MRGPSSVRRTVRESVVYRSALPGHLHPCCAIVNVAKCKPGDPEPRVQDDSWLCLADERPDRLVNLPPLPFAGEACVHQE